MNDYIQNPEVRRINGVIQELKRKRAEINAQITALYVKRSALFKSKPKENYPERLKALTEQARTRHPAIKLTTYYADQLKEDERRAKLLNI